MKQCARCGVEKPPGEFHLSTRHGRQSWCADCGRRFHPVSMHFDHRPGEPKEFEIGWAIRGYSRKRILAEIAKCDLVCANCHAVRTYERLHGA